MTSNGYARRWPVTLVAILAAAYADLAGAASSRTFVASYGSDANPCTVANPCRSFAAALAATAPYGQVIVLDSAGYGTVAIAQSVAIVAPDGVFAGIGVPLAGVGVDVAASNVEVRLVGMSIGGGAVGVNVGGHGSIVQLDRCVVADATFGLVAEGATRVTVTNSRFVGNFRRAAVVKNGASAEFDRVTVVGDRWGDFNEGIVVASEVGVLPMNVSISDAFFAGSRLGVQVFSMTSAPLRVSIAGSTFARSSFGVGVLCNSPNCAAPGTVHVTATGNTFTSVDVAIQVSGQNATIAASSNTIGGGEFGLQNIDGVLVSFGNNVVEGTTNPTAGTITTSAPR